ncbi:hypothetical protein GOBAR_DD10485 [Gossypium barbadense]|nr:hypothetical protein GOBAR_DD10485 [Gossypium barbadense]
MVVLDGNVLDLRKHSAVVFKKDSNSKKGQVLGIGGDDGVGKVVFILKARDLNDKDKQYGSHWEFQGIPIERIKFCINKEVWSIEYVLRDENMEADSITKLTFGRDEGL